MPDTIYSALNTGGTEVVSDAERLRAQLRQQAIDNAFRSQMLGQQNSLAMAELADRGNDRANRLQGIGLQNSGNLAVEGQRGQNQMGVAQIDTAPAMGELGLRRDAYNEGRPLRDAQMTSTLQDLAVKNGLRRLVASQIPGYQDPQIGGAPAQTIDGAAQARAAASPVGNGLRTQYVTPGASGGFVPPFKGGSVSTDDSSVYDANGINTELGVARGTGVVQRTGEPGTAVFYSGSKAGTMPGQSAAPGLSPADAAVMRAIQQQQPAGAQGAAAPVGAAPGGVPGAGGLQSVDPKSLRGIAALASIYGAMTSGSPANIPDYELQDAERAKTLRDLKTGEVKDAVDRGDIPGAKNLAGGTPGILPQREPEAVATEPDVQDALARMRNAVSTITSKRYYGSDSSPSGFTQSDDYSALQRAINDGIKAMSSKLVDPAKAHAFILNQIRSLVPYREDSLTEHPGMTLHGDRLIGMLAQSGGL